MAYLTGEPRVDIREIDLSQIITSSSSNVGVIVGQAERGPVNKRVLITLDTDFTSIFGSTDTNKYGFLSSTALTFLQGSNQLYVTRVVGDGASFAGLVVAPSSESEQVDTLMSSEQGISYPYQFVLTKKPVIYSTLVFKVSDSIIATLDDDGNIVMKSTETNKIEGRYVYDTNTVVITSNTYDINTTITASYSYATNPATITTQLSSGEMTSEDYDFSSYGYAEANIIAIYADNQGLWGNNLKVSVGNIDTRDSTFDISVFETVDGIDLLRETYHVSRKEQLDGLGNQLYLEDVINGNSLWIRVKDLDKTNDALLPATFTKAQLAGGLDGAQPSQSQIAAGYSLYESWEDIDVDIVMDAGYVSETDTTVQNKITSVCEKRQDCVGVFEVPYSQTAMSPTTKCTDWRQNLQAISSNYVGLYTPWIKARDTFKNKIIEVPPCGYIGALMAQLPDTYYAPAGLENGILSSDAFPVVGLTQDYTSGQKDLLYDSGVNVIKSYPSVGYVAWGQKTQQTKASALDRWNVRRSLNTIKRAIRKAYMYQLFKNNDEWTRASLSNAVTEYMNTRKAAFYDFKVICDETNNTPEVIDRNHIVLTVMVKPVKTAEYGILNIVITSTGVEFSSVEGSIVV